MRNSSLIRPVFNRKNLKLEADDTAIVQIEVLFVDGRRKFFDTGIRLQPSQWDKRRRSDNIIGHPTAPALNKKIRDTIAALADFEMSLHSPMTPDDVGRFLNNETIGTMTFVEYMDKELKGRKDIVYATRKRHELTIERLKRAGIINFHDLTYNNIKRFDAVLHDEISEQTTIYKVHGVVKTYIHLAEKAGILRHDLNPYTRFDVAKGRHKVRIRLDDDEIEKIQAKEMPEYLELTRDLYLFQMFTGIAYKDLCGLKRENLRTTDGDVWIEGIRAKSGEFYSVFLLPEAKAIMEKYVDANSDLMFHCPPLVKQNSKLKLVAEACGINKTLTTHTARHTFATMLLRKGVSLGVIQAQLGHTKIETTQVYAHMEREIVRNQMRQVK